MHCLPIIRLPAFRASPNLPRRPASARRPSCGWRRSWAFRAFRPSRRNCRAELSAQLQNPIARHDRWSSEAPEEHILNSFSDAALDNLRTSIKRLDHREFDRIAELLAQRRHHVHVVGGRITHPLAQYFHTHLGMVRPGISLMPRMPALWPQYLLNIDKHSLLVVFDIRRYDPQILELARLAAGARRHDHPDHRPMDEPDFQPSRCIHCPCASRCRRAGIRISCRCFSSRR